MPSTKRNIPLIRRPWFAFFSSMRFAVALLCVLAIASIIGTVLQQNQPAQNYVVKFGPFWAEIFGFLGLFDVYASIWFVIIMLFLVISTGLCLWRNVPPFLRDMRSFRTKITEKSLQHMKHNAPLSPNLTPDIAAQYLRVNGFQTKQIEREDGSILLAAKKGAMNKWGYICAHLAIIVICLGGLIDSNLLLKIGIITGKLVPDNSSVYARDFKENSTLGIHNLAYRANAEVIEGQTIDQAFINANKGLLLQKLPFSIELKKFFIEFYDTGMPRDFASDIIVTNRETGKQTQATIRVNHPLTIDGVTIYQSTYGDGGSPISFKTWNLASIGKAQTLNVTSQRSFPLNLGEHGQYQLELGELRPFNVENIDNVSDARTVKQGKIFQNIGATIRFKLRDSAGQAHEYINYILPLEREGALFYATGERSGLDEDFRWLMLPADSKGKLDSFMALRDTLLQENKRDQIVAQAIKEVNQKMLPDFKLALEKLLFQFSQGGYQAIDEHIQKIVPQEYQAETSKIMYQILYKAMDIALTQALADYQLPEMPQGETRSTFLINSLNAYTSLTRFQSPILLQMNSYTPVNMSGLQMTKSPGANLVYLGSLLLVLGTIFMFYVREKRAWLLFNQDEIRFAMSATRSERELIQEFPEHYNKLQRLAQDLHQTHS